ncbi:MAG: hypothetical protein ACRDRM_02330 [Pseudonocardiaceae bacterium]
MLGKRRLGSRRFVWAAMNVEPVICACGNPVSGGGDHVAAVLYGPMCDACIKIFHHQAGRLCDRCIYMMNAEYPGVRFALSNQHPLVHSHVLDTCVDRAILPFLEGFNQNVAPTFSSCQGVDMLPGRPGRWAQEPFIMVDGQHQLAVTAWAERTADRYRISAVHVHNEGSPYHRVGVDFADTPMTWLG